MAYSNNPNLPKARAFALKLLLIDGIALSVVANRCGVHRSTIWRWKRKWEALNQYRQLDNPNRPSRPVGKAKLLQCQWRITTISSRPHHYPWSIPEDIIHCILAVRQQLRRCAEVVWHHLNAVLQIQVSLSSVRRILKRNHCLTKARKNRIRPDNPRRPQITKPGELVQTDTIHYTPKGKPLVQLV